MYADIEILIYSAVQGLIIVPGKEANEDNLGK